MICNSCGKERCEGLAIVSPRKVICAICYNHKRSASPRSYGDFEGHFFYRKQVADLAAIGLTKCQRCKKEKTRFDFHKAAPICKSCKSDEHKAGYSLEKRRATYKAERPKRRKTGMTATEYTAAQIASAAARRQRDEHVKDFYRWLYAATPTEKGDHWIKNGFPWKDPRLTVGERYALRYKMDARFNLKERMRRQLTKARKNDNIADVIRQAIRREGESLRVEIELGYTISQLMIHLESKFIGDMCWDEFMRGNIHIDHIRPQASFDLTDYDQWRECWSMDNLQPLWAADNLAKGAKWGDAA